MMKIWGRISSINVRKVVWCAQELGLAYSRTDAGGRFGVVQTPDYRALNPNALVPSIEVHDNAAAGGSFRLWESNVIVRYLCARHAYGDLYPEALPARASAAIQVERFMKSLFGCLRYPNLPPSRDAGQRDSERPCARHSSARSSTPRAAGRLRSVAK